MITTTPPLLPIGSTAAHGPSSPAVAYEELLSLSAGNSPSFSSPAAAQGRRQLFFSGTAAHEPCSSSRMAAHEF
ncbi:hypothetical protein PIB30_076267 [Stylosanthes scabra]|uniref:Uncharacterized protein n=1 Tax=Stylosanthes scabra TaxID=79078 RepID=A0ABU6XR69_9FABA|nr:hypothetical protein [Stylosanthes scabra]